MKQLVVVNDVSADRDILAILDATGIVYRTRYTRCTGTGPRTGPREDTHIWPGYNVMTIAVVEDALAQKAMEAIQAFRDLPGHAQTGVFAYVTPVDAVLPASRPRE